MLKKSLLDTFEQEFYEKTDLKWKNIKITAEQKIGDKTEINEVSKVDIEYACNEACCHACGQTIYKISIFIGVLIFLFYITLLLGGALEANLSNIIKAPFILFFSVIGFYILFYFINLMLDGLIERMYSKNTRSRSAG